jgi:hypothetical protein
MSKKITRIPLNLNKKSCSAISSNCVVWQGPDIPCLDLCKGDTVTEVVYQLGIEFCSLFEQLQPESYNAQCLNLGECTVTNFQELFQAVIDKICSLSVDGCNLYAQIVKTSPSSFTVNVDNSYGALTYQWSIQESSETGVVISGPTTNQSVLLDLSGTADGTTVTLLKVKVTDANGCIGTDTMLIINKI